MGACNAGTANQEEVTTVVPGPAKRMGKRPSNAMEVAKAAAEAATTKAQSKPIQAFVHSPTQSRDTSVVSGADHSADSSAPSTRSTSPEEKSIEALPKTVVSAPLKPVDLEMFKVPMFIPIERPKRRSGALPPMSRSRNRSRKGSGKSRKTIASKKVFLPTGDGELEETRAFHLPQGSRRARSAPKVFMPTATGSMVGSPRRKLQPLKAKRKLKPLKMKDAAPSSSFMRQIKADRDALIDIRQKKKYLGKKLAMPSRVIDIIGMYAEWNEPVKDDGFLVAVPASKK